MVVPIWIMIYTLVYLSGVELKQNSAIWKWRVLQKAFEIWGIHAVHSCYTAYAIHMLYTIIRKATFHLSLWFTRP